MRNIILVLFLSLSAVAAAAPDCEEWLKDPIFRILKRAVAQQEISLDHLRQMADSVEPVNPFLLVPRRTDNLSLGKAYAREFTLLKGERWMAVRAGILELVNQKTGELEVREKSRVETDSVFNPVELGRMPVPSSIVNSVEWRPDSQELEIFSGKAVSESNYKIAGLNVAVKTDLGSMFHIGSDNFVVLRHRDHLKIMGRSLSAAVEIFPEYSPDSVRIFANEKEAFLVVRVRALEMHVYRFDGKSAHWEKSFEKTDMNKGMSGYLSKSGELYLITDSSGHFLYRSRQGKYDSFQTDVSVVAEENWDEDPEGRVRLMATAPGLSRNIQILHLQQAHVTLEDSGLKEENSAFRLRVVHHPHAGEFWIVDWHDEVQVFDMGTRQMMFEVTGRMIFNAMTAFVQDGRFLFAGLWEKGRESELRLFQLWRKAN